MFHLLPLNGVCKFKSIVKPLSMFMSRYPSMAFPPKAAVELSFKHTGDLHNFECNGEYMKDGKKTEEQLTMITATGLNVRASLRTPYLEDITTKIFERSGNF
jgi:hypothetical protein